MTILQLIQAFAVIGVDIRLRVKEVIDLFELWKATETKASILAKEKPKK